MGLFTGLLTLPLAPVRGVVWVTEQIAEEIDRQLYDEANIRRELLALELDYDDGKIDEQEREAQEEALFERLAISQARTEAFREQQALREREALHEQEAQDGAAQ